MKDRMTDDKFITLHEWLKTKLDNEEAYAVYIDDISLSVEELLGYVNEVEARLGLSPAAQKLRLLEKIHKGNLCCFEDNCKECPYSEEKTKNSWCTQWLLEDIQGYLDEEIERTKKELE